MRINKTSFFSRFLIGIVSIFAIYGLMNVFMFSVISEDDGEYRKLIDSTYSVYSLPFDEEPVFAGEKVPTEFIDVKESIDMEVLKVSYWHSEFFLYLKRAKRYFPTIEKILKENNIPDDFKYLAMIESGLSNAVSPKGAVGVWQFMKETGKEYGLEINKEIDERYHIEKSTKAACKLLKYLYEKFGSWTMAAAAYNTGQGNLQEQVEKQKQKNYYDLLLNQETSRYIYRIIVVKYMYLKPQNFGFKYREKDLYPPIKYKTVKIDSSVTDFADFAQKYKTTYKFLKKLNPWLRTTKLTNPKKKEYEIKIPEEGSRLIKNYKFENDTIKN